MASSAVIHTFAVQLADIDRGVYEDLALRVARHPSETDAFMMTRVLAYCLEFEEGIAFSEGISSTDEPAVLVRDPIEVTEKLDSIANPKIPLPPDLFGEERLIRTVAGAPEGVAQVGEAIVAAVRGHAVGRSQSDDITLVCFGRGTG